jgi:predicted phosphodiesterase
MKRVLVLSDIHVGHKFAVSPLSFELPDGGSYQANRVQKALFAAWSEVAAEWKNPDILVINGEPIDGQQTKNLGVEVWTTDYLEQIKASIELVKMFNAKKIYVTRGSNYHVQVGGVSVEEIFGQMVGAERVDGLHVSAELFLDIDGTKFNVAHHIGSSASGWQYKSTPIAKEMMLMKLIESRKWPVDVLVRSHVHYYWAVQTPSHTGVINPCWQLQTWFQIQKGAAGLVPDIGAVRFNVGTEKNYTWEKKLFKLPETRPPLVKA